MFWWCGSAVGFVIDFGVSVVPEFQFHSGCWRRWVCCGGAVTAGLVVLGLL